MRIISLICLLFYLSIDTAATTHLSDGSQSDVQAKIDGAAPSGDTVMIPAGSFTWGASGTHVQLNKAVILQGAGNGATTIVMSASGVTGADGVIVISAAATMKDLAITGTANGSVAVTPLTFASATDLRVTNVTYTGPAVTGYFCYSAGSVGVVDRCTFINGHGSSQLFQVRGPASWWSVPHTMGTAASLFIEECTFGGIGCTASVTTGGAGRATIRYNTFLALMPIDGHMIETETTTEGTPHGSRQLEIYGNVFPDGYADSIWVAGGTAMIFNNVFADGTGAWTHFLEYGANAGSATYGGTWTTPAMSPIPDQIGMGPYPQVRGAEAIYYWGNRKVSGADHPFAGATVSAGALAQYGSAFYQTSNEGSPSMLTDGLDYFRGVVGGDFPSTTKIGIGTKAEMLASSPTAAGQGWAVTDEGSWNKTVAANMSGQLYTWSGSAWVLKYTSYTYPHPLRGIVYYLAAKSRRNPAALGTY